MPGQSLLLRRSADRSGPATTDTCARSARRAALRPSSSVVMEYTAKPAACRHRLGSQAQGEISGVMPACEADDGNDKGECLSKGFYAQKKPGRAHLHVLSAGWRVDCAGQAAVTA